MCAAFPAANNGQSAVFGSSNPRPLSVFWGVFLRALGHFQHLLEPKMRKQHQRQGAVQNSLRPMQLVKGNTRFLLIGDMTDLHAGCDPFCLLSVEHLKFRCLAQANVLLSRRPLCQAWLPGRDKRENPSSLFFHYKKKKEVFRFH